MLGALSSLFASLFFAISVIQIRKCLKMMHWFSAILTVTIIQNIVFWPLTLLFVPLDSLNPLGILFFMLAGVFHPGISRLAYYKGIETLGAPLNTSLIAIYPLFASLFAISLLDENPTIWILVGMSFIVIGGILLEGSLRNPHRASAKYARSHLIYPLSAAVIIGLGNVLRKLGLLEINQVLIGVSSGSLVALSVYGFILLSSSKMRSSAILNKKVVNHAGLAGLVLCGAWFFNFYALSIEEVTVVASLRSTTPLFVFLFAYLFLRKLERLTLKMLVGTLVITLGVLTVIAN